MKLFVAGLILGGTVVAVLVGSCDARSTSAREEQHRREVSKWQAMYAEASTQAARDGTVFVRIKARVDTMRDSIPVWQHDTIYQKEYVARTDSALHACSDLANSCKLALAHADSVQWSMQHEIDWWKKRKTPRNKPCGLVIGAGGLLANGQPLRSGLIVGAACRVWP